MSVACGLQHTLVVSSAASIYAWGYGADGQLGFPAQEDIFVPTRIDTVAMSAVDVVMVAASGNSSAAVAKDGTVYTWGYCHTGREGPYPATIKEPTRRDKTAFGGSPAVMVACGTHHTMVLTADGRLWTFGKGSNGQLGHGGVEFQLEGGGADWMYKGVLAPTPITHFSEVLKTKIVMMAAGEEHSMALTAEGVVYTWGSNKSFALGHQGVGVYGTPVMLERASFTGSNVVYIQAGDHHSAAVTKEGTLFMWGCESDGVLGLGGCDGFIENPTPLNQNEFGGVPVYSVTCGKTHTMAITKDGRLWMWGVSGDWAGEWKEPGGQSCTGRFLRPHPIDPIHFGGARIVAASAGQHFSAVVTDLNELFGWGWEISHRRSFYGRTVLGFFRQDEEPTPVRLPSYSMQGALVGRYQSLSKEHALAFAMGSHSRLGSEQRCEKGVYTLDAFLMKMIVEASGTKPEGRAGELEGFVRLMGAGNRCY